MAEEFEQYEENAGAEAETETPESAPGEQQEPQPDGQSSKDGGAFGKRIRELTARERAAKEEAEYWRQEAIRSRTVTPEVPKQEPQPEVVKPKASDFENHEEFVEALTDWKIEQRDKKREQVSAEDRIRSEQEQRQTAFQQRQNEFRSKTPDFDDAMSGPDVQVSQSVIQEILTNENGPQLQYWLVKNPDQAERLNKMAPMQLAREIGRLESRFMAPAEGKQAPATRVPPTPIRPVSGSTAAGTTSLDVDDYSEYERRRQAQLKR